MNQTVAVGWAASSGHRFSGAQCGVAIGIQGVEPGVGDGVIQPGEHVVFARQLTERADGLQ